MTHLLRREFTVELPLEAAWEHLARVTDWPSWARHIKRIDMQSGPLGPDSSGTICLSNGIKSTFSMTEFNPGSNWKWVGGFLWMKVHYDHLFESVSPSQTRLIWTVDGEGFGVSVIGKLFARIYNKNLDQAVPRLIQEMQDA